MLCVLATAISSVLGKGLVVPGSELWTEMPVPDDNQVPQFTINVQETLFPNSGDCKGTYLRDNWILTNVLEQISKSDKSYEQIQKFVTWVVDDGGNSQYVPPAHEDLSSFPGPSLLFDFMKSHAAFVQRDSRVDINWIFLLFVIRTAQDRDLMNTVEGVPFSEVACNFLSDLDAFFASTSQIRSLREAVRDIFDSISSSCKLLSEELGGMSDRKEPPAAFYEYLDCSVHLASLRAKIALLKDKFALFCGLIHSDFNADLSEAAKQRLVYSMSRNYRIVRTMVECFVHARMERRGSKITVSRELGQMLSRLGVDLLMYSLKYDLDYEHIEAIAFDGGYPVRKKSIWKMLRKTPIKPVPWKSIVLGRPETSTPPETNTPPETSTPPNGDYHDKLKLLDALFELIKTLNPHIQGTLNNLGELESMVKSIQSFRCQHPDSCIDVACCHSPNSIFKDTGWAIFFCKPDEFWTSIEFLGLKAKRERLLGMKSKIMLMDILAPALILAFNAYAILQIYRRLRNSRRPESSNSETGALQHSEQLPIH